MRFRWRMAVGVVLVALVVAGFGVAHRIERSGSCHGVAELVGFDRSQQDYLESRMHIPAAGSYEEFSTPSDADYQNWVDGLERRAREVTAPELAPHARRAADLAGPADNAHAPGAQRGERPGSLRYGTPALGAGLRQGRHAVQHRNDNPQGCVPGRLMIA